MAFNYAEDIEQQIMTAREESNKPREPIPEGDLQGRVVKVSHELSRSSKQPCWQIAVTLIGKTGEEFWHKWDRTLFVSEQVQWVMANFMELLRLHGADFTRLQKAKGDPKKALIIMQSIAEDALFGKVIPMYCKHEMYKDKLTARTYLDWKKALDEDEEVEDGTAPDALPTRPAPAPKKVEPEKDDLEDVTEPASEPPKANPAKKVPARVPNPYEDLV